MQTLTIKQTGNFRVDALGGVTEQKKAELDALAIQVLDEQQNVDQFQAIVNSLTEKTNLIQSLLNIDENNRSNAYNNKLLIDQMVYIAKDLYNNSKIAIHEMGEANVRTKELAPAIKILVDKLIYVTEIINKLSNTIIRKKALNPLISDDLISMLGTAGKNANDAVAVTLIALQSTFAAQASNLETEMAVALEEEQSNRFLEILNGSSSETPVKQSLAFLLTDAYSKARIKYKKMEKAFKIVTKQLSEANSNLSKAQVKLKSLQSGLAAANAAALAS
jgi:hypothetical protein